MTESNGIYVSNIPSNVSSTDLLLAFSRLTNHSPNITYVLFPLEEDPTRAYIQFSDFPGSLQQYYILLL